MQEKIRNIHATDPTKTIMRYQNIVSIHFLGLREGLKDVCVQRFHDKINLTPIRHHLIDMMLLSHSTENDTSQAFIW